MKDSTVEDIQFINIPKIVDEQGRGKLSVIEKQTLPFKIKRVYYLYDVPSDAYRGGHAHRRLLQFIIPLSGSFEVILDDGQQKRRVMLNKPDKGIFLPTGLWRELDNFSSGAVCLILASEEFDESDYIREYKDFLNYKGL